MKPYRPGFEPDKSVDALGWVGKRVHCDMDGGFDGIVLRSDDRPNAGGSMYHRTGEWGWFQLQNEEYPDGILMHSSEVELVKCEAAGK